MSTQAPLPSPSTEPSFWEWLSGHSGLLGWMFVLSIGSLVLTGLLLPVFVARLPWDYFLASRGQLARRRGVVQWLLRIGKNLLGLVFVLAGIAMLVLPGQGLLTILIGLLLVDFPGKRAIELRIVRRPTILKFLNSMRSRRGQPPLQVE
ncbi:MAG: PGPGW domain-containing protein [Planctomycetota bacterium]